MSTKVVIVVPPHEQLMGVKRNVSCPEEGCCCNFVHEGALRMHLVKSHGQIKTDADKRLFHNGKINNKEKVQYHFHCPESPCYYSEGSQRHFTTHSQLKQHYMKVHAEKKFVCSKCERRFSMERNMGRHQENCGVLFQCETCPVKYTTREVLQTHCKRQNHTYPKQYRKKDKEKEVQKRKPERTQQAPAAPVVSRVPVILIAVSTPPPALPTPVRSIKPKQVIPPSPVELDSKVITQDKVMGHSQDPVTLRQDALIQTDIYGVGNLSVSGRDQRGITLVNNRVNAYTGFQAQGEEEYVNENERSKVMLEYQNKQTVKEYSWRVPPKKQAAVKRKLALNALKYQNLSPSPRRKKMKSTTGIQTSVSLTQKKNLHTVSGTQTTGDYILKTAMAKADIQIERKTVASQVTPQKPNQIKTVELSKKCTSETQTLVDTMKDHLSDTSVADRPGTKPALVDSYSQVKQRNIWAETSHNLAESQTMTDLPPSISTQTLQSYLVNVQERNLLSKKQLKPFQKGHLVPQYRNKSSISGHETILIGNPDNFIMSSGSPAALQNTNSTYEFVTDQTNTVKIYNQSLDSSSTFILPAKQQKIESSRCLSDAHSSPIKLPVAGADGKPLSDTNFLTSTRIESSVKEQKQQSDVLIVANSDIVTQGNDMNTSDSINSVHPQHAQYDSISQTTANEKHTSSGNSVLSTKKAEARENSVFTSSNTNTVCTNSNTLEAKGLTIDTEAQAMSATEFELLLQSSGIFLDNSDLVSTSSQKPVQSSVQKLPNTSQTVDIGLGPEFDFLSNPVDTIDMNTQTASDFSLFESCVSIDTGTNTQAGNDIDFLDLVMTNMETQTLNEDDLISLGLASVDDNYHSLGVGTSDFDQRTVVDNTVHGIGVICTGEQSSSIGSTSHSLGVGTSDSNCTDQQTSQTQNSISVTGTAAYISPSSRKNEVGHLSDTDSQTFIRNQSGAEILASDNPPVQCTAHSSCNLLCNLDEKVTLQSETQTMAVDTVEPLVQTETQTQVEIHDVDFETMNMETQTTFEDLQQLCSWFDNDTK